MDNKILNLDDYRPSEDGDDYGYTPAMGVTREEWKRLYESASEDEDEILFPSLLDTPEPESYDSLEEYKLIRDLKEADGNDSGLERTRNLEEARKFMLGQEADLEKAMKGLAYSQVMTEKTIRRMKTE